MNEYYLEHHGVKGQKWGIRRYQNKDGSLTSAGKKRYSDDNDSNSEAPAKVTVVRSEDSERVREIRKKKISEMSNQELKTAIERMNLERQYRDLKSSEINSGKKKVDDALKYVDTANKLYNLYNSPLGKAAQKLILAAIGL